MTQSTGAGNRRILIIDDNAAIHEDFRKVLAHSERRDDALQHAEAALFGEAAPAIEAVSFEIDSAFQGEEGLAMVRRAHAEGRPYAVAFVDVRMPPGWDGVETVSRIWREHPDLQVVVCTAYSDYSWEDMVRLLEHGENLLILKKPCENIEVRQLARALTAKWDLSRRVAMRLAEVETLVGQRTHALQAANDRLRDQVRRREDSEKRLEHDAFHDSLTGLPNRAMLMKRLSGLGRSRAGEPPRACAVLFIDIDNFKLVNDSQGHVIGDKLLIEAARRLSKSVRGPDREPPGSSDMTARLGGDEFVVLLDGLAAPDDATRVAQRIQSALATPIRIGAHEFVVSASIGMVQMAGGEMSPEEVLRNADVALYEAKGDGRGRYVVFDESMLNRVRSRHDLERDLRLALDGDDLHVEFQPIVNLETGRVTSFEALARWTHPRRGPIGPAEFIPIAEETGLILSIGQRVLDRALSLLNRFSALPEGRQVSINVNLSRRQLFDPAFLPGLRALLEKWAVPAGRLCLEVTESTVMTRPGDMLASLRALKALGVQLSLDDFGTGLSSLSLLRMMPFDGLKIDRAFLDAAAGDRQAIAVLHAIITLGRNLDKVVTAEGVSDEAQLATALALGCDRAQGFLFGEPMPVSDPRRMLALDYAQRHAAEFQAAMPACTGAAAANGLD